jgi:enolase
MTDQRFILESVTSALTISTKGCVTDEYSLRFDDGAVGRGSAPLGETRSRYEAEGGDIDAPSVVQALAEDGILGREFCQTEFDQYLTSNVARMGPSAAFSLSCAFFEAALRSYGGCSRPEQAVPPRFCLNILNGGRHAYTNPVLSDFHEYLLLPQHTDIAMLLDDHHSIQERVRNRLSAMATTRVSGNVVHVLGGQGNRDCIEFLLGVLDDLGLAHRYGLMIDAAAAQLWDGTVYALDLAEKRNLSPDELEDYWTGILADYPVALLEDPFAEHDLERWSGLAATATDCIIAGDDVHSGDPGRIRQLLDSACMTGTVLKPDQAGTISATLEAMEVARAAKSPVILSHRSISTDSLVLAHLMVHCGIELAKFGPLLSDFSSILKMNEVIRATKDGCLARGAEGPVENVARDAHAGD